VYCKQAKKTKRLYKTAEAADMALRAIREHVKVLIDNAQQDPARKIPKRVYFCARCNGHHLSSRDFFDSPAEQ
jgi:hypothetical protein